MNDSTSLVRAILQPVLIAVIAGLLLRGAVQTYSIPSESMSPALQTGDHILVTPFDAMFHHSEPRRGDVIVFRSPYHEGESFVKRVVALPGDELELREDEIRVNGRTLPEPWIPLRHSNGTRPPQILPDGQYFVMGDARDNSVDSRSFGLVPRDQMIGRAKLIFWSSGSEFSDTANASVFDSSSAPRPGLRPGLRWGRMLTPVR